MIPDADNVIHIVVPYKVKRRKMIYFSVPTQRPLFFSVVVEISECDLLILRYCVMNRFYVIGQIRVLRFYTTTKIQVSFQNVRFI